MFLLLSKYCLSTVAKSHLLHESFSKFSINLSLFLISAAHIVYAGISQGVLGNVEDIKWHADIISSSEARLSH